MPSPVEFPTIQHQRAAEAATDFFSQLPGIDAVLLTASCARGTPSPESDVDIVVLVPPEITLADRSVLAQGWRDFSETEEVFRDLERLGPYVGPDVDISDGRFVPRPRGWTSGPDDFELEIGNIVAYTVPLWEANDRLAQLRAQWLPYYDDALREQRLAQTIRFCRNNLDHIPGLVRRDLYFQAFDRLYNAFQEFLQALFIARRTYPVAYDKWIRDQIENLLNLPDLYPRLPKLFEIHHFESDEIVRVQ